MGNSVSSHQESNVFQKELGYINNVVSNIITEKNVFKNRDYNFLSQDVCNQHFIIMESELNRHLKVQLNNLGESLYLVPREGTARAVNKKELCQKISHHYMKILYILCLIKYVYNLEAHGDYSVAGIMFHNIRIVDDIIEIHFCNVPQKDFSKEIKDAYKLDFGKLEGLKFLTEYFMDQEESAAFVKVMKNVLSKAGKGRVNKNICAYIDQSKASMEHVHELERIYKSRFNTTLQCKGLDIKDKDKSKHFNLYMYVEKENPIFSKSFCAEVHKYVIQLKTTGGKKVLEQYNTMKRNYDTNIKKVEALINMLVVKETNGGFALKDIDKEQLDKIVYDVKDCIKTFYIQTIIDYQVLLELSKNTPNINMIK